MPWDPQLLQQRELKEKKEVEAPDLLPTLKGEASLLGPGRHPSSQGSWV